MTMITRKAVLLAKKEVDYATDPTPVAGTDAFEAISDLVINPVGTLLSRLPYSNSLSPVRPLIGQRWYEISFVVEVKGSGTAGTAPRGLGALLQACGMSETIVASTSVTYAPASSTIASCTIYAFLDGLRHIFVGCRGTWRLLSIAGETAKLEFRMLGKYAAPTDVAIASPTYDSTVPPVIVSASFTFDSVATFAVQQLEIELGVITANRDDLNDATGIKGFEIVGRDGRGSMNPESVLIATHDFWTIWTAATQKQLSIALGATAGNICTVTCPKAVLETLGYGDRNGIRTFEIPFRLSQNTGDDEVSIAFT